VKHGKTPLHWSPDQKILCYLQQKLYLSCGTIKQKKNLCKEAYDYYIKCLEFGPIYSPNIRSKCYASLSELLKEIDMEVFQEEIEYTSNLSHFYKHDKKKFLFLLDSTKELNQNLSNVLRLIRDIFDKKMKTIDHFSIYCFSHEIKLVQESISKKSIKNSEMEVFNENYELLKKYANETFRHPWDAISEALDILVENSDVTDHVPFSKYLVVFVFGDVVPLVNRNTRPTTKKMTILWQQNVQEMNKRNLNYEKLIEKLEDGFVNLIIFGYNLEPATKVMYQKVCEVAKNGLFVNINNEHLNDDTSELLEFF